MKKGHLVIFLVLFVGTMMPQVSGQDDFNHVISNSEDWRDVYSTLHYASLAKVGGDFLVSTRHGPLLLYGIKEDRDILIVSSEDRPFVFGYEDLVRGRGYRDVDEIIVKDANLELIDRLPEISNFIIVGDTYGYNAVAVTPYAVQTESWVFLVDRRSIADVISKLDNRDVDNVLIYGFVEREIREELDKYNPEIIDNGDRFEDNVEIVEEYLELKDVKQVALTNGEFIEKQLMSGIEPVLFTGKDNVPDNIADYLKKSPIEVGVLVGSDLVGAATNIRRSTGISVIVKFARGSRSPTGGAISAIEGLDLFRIPTPDLILDIHSVKYNSATSQLEVTYTSQSNAPIYFRGTIDVTSDDGDSQRVGDADSVFIAPNDFRTVTYPDFQISGDEFTARVVTLYGETRNALEKVLDRTLDVEKVNILDQCEIDVDSVTYRKTQDAFVIKLINIGETECFADVELVDVIVDGREQTLGSEGSISIQPGKKGEVVIDSELTDEDLEDNSIVSLVVYYGERSDSLVKVLRGEFSLDVIFFSTMTIILIVVSLIILLLIVILIVSRMREDRF